MSPLLRILLVLAASVATTSAGLAPQDDPGPPGSASDGTPGSPGSPWAQGAWPSWRGPLSTGEAPDADPPLEWSETENVRWKVALPGAGNGTPVVWGDAIFLLTAEPVGEPVRPAATPGDTSQLKPFQRKVTVTHKQRLSVLAVRLSDGARLWSRVAVEELPHEEVHEDATWAASSAVTDGEHVFADFGSRGLYAYDLAGNQVWKLRLGEMEHLGFGEGSTPALRGDTLVVQHDHQGPSFLVALDKSTGRELWRRERDEPSSWSSPLIVDVDGRAQVVASGARKVRGHDLASGELLWEWSGLTPNVIPTPVYRDGVAYVMSGFRGAAIAALRLTGAKGDLTDTNAVLWTGSRNTSYVRSPLLFDGRLYVLKAGSGILTCLDATSGRAVFGPQRLTSLGDFYASPVAAGGRVYLVGREGTTEVLRAGDAYSVLATNHLDERFSASPAVVGDALLLRGERHLYCVARAR